MSATDFRADRGSDPSFVDGNRHTPSAFTDGNMAAYAESGTTSQT
jgi:hypothetical protein